MLAVNSHDLHNWQNAFVLPAAASIAVADATENVSCFSTAAMSMYMYAHKSNSDI